MATKETDLVAPSPETKSNWRRATATATIGILALSGCKASADSVEAAPSPPGAVQAAETVDPAKGTEMPQDTLAVIDAGQRLTGIDFDNTTNEAILQKYAVNAQSLNTAGESWLREELSKKGSGVTIVDTQLMWQHWNEDGMFYPEFFFADEEQLIRQPVMNSPTSTATLINTFNTLLANKSIVVQPNTSESRKIVNAALSPLFRAMPEQAGCKFECIDIRDDAGAQSLMDSLYSQTKPGDAVVDATISSTSYQPDRRSTGLITTVRSPDGSERFVDVRVEKSLLPYPLPNDDIRFVNAHGDQIWNYHEWIMRDDPQSTDGQLFFPLDDSLNANLSRFN